MLPKKLTREVICAPDYPVVQTKYGKLRGMEVEGAFIFRGIRYAKAKRFRAPEEQDSWDGIKNATAFGPCCRELSTLQPQDAFTVPHFWYPQDEDCQFLNIWTQSINAEAKRPVMVWIHGGGMHHGSGVEIYAYDGEELSKRGDLVVVSLNHRLNVLGYCDLSAFGEEYKDSGNVGQMDIVAALRWIHDNIEAFGGDPENVTIFGQSGGGSKITALLQCPAADGLYHRVSLQSGVSATPRERFHEEATEISRLILQALGIEESNISQIDTVPFHKLALAVDAAGKIYKQKYGKRMMWMAISDGSFYVGHPGRVGFRRETANIPMLVGTVMGEFSNNTIDTKITETGPKYEWSDELFKEKLEARFGKDGDSISQLFAAAYPNKCRADVLYTDFAKRTEHVNFAKMRAKTEGAGPVYNFLIAPELPADGGATAWHNADEAFIFHNARYIEGVFDPAYTDGLEDMVCDAWISFAYTGNPNHPHMPKWTPVVSNVTATMVFAEKSEMKYDFDDELLKLGVTLPEAKFNDGPPMGLGGSPRVRV